MNRGLGPSGNSPDPGAPNRWRRYQQSPGQGCDCPKWQISPNGAEPADSCRRAITFCRSAGVFIPSISASKRLDRARSLLVDPRLVHARAVVVANQLLYAPLLPVLPRGNFVENRLELLFRKLARSPAPAPSGHGSWNGILRMPCAVGILVKSVQGSALRSRSPTSIPCCGPVWAKSDREQSETASRSARKRMNQYSPCFRCFSGALCYRSKNLKAIMAAV